MTAAAAAVPSPHSVSKSVDSSAPSAVRDTSVANSYTSPDLAAHQAPYVSPPQGQVLGASTDNTDARFGDLQNQIDALKNLPRSVFVPSFSGPAASTPVSTQTFAAAQKIDKLSGVTISNSTIDTASIPNLSGAYLSIASTSVARSTLGLTYASNADIKSLRDIEIVAWGDSLTNGYRSNTSYPVELESLTGFTVYNYGDNGERVHRLPPD